MIFGRSARTFETLLPITVLVLLAIGCFVVLRPFLTAVLWAAILSYSTWPVYRSIHRNLHGSRTWAAAIMTATVTGVLVVPAFIVGSELVENSVPVINAVRAVLDDGLPPPPAWVGSIPIFGPEIVQYWQTNAADGSTIARQLRASLGPAQGLILTAAATIGAGLLELGLSMLISFFFYRDGALIARRLQRALERLGGTRAIQLLAVAGSTIKGVVYGILGTALAQSALAMIGFIIVQVPGAVFLGFLTFFMSLLPMGPPLVWVPVVVWLGIEERYGAALFLALWGLIAISGIDNLVKPYLISRAGNLPFILVLLGAFGGVVAFGLIGVFLGPILLALGFNLILEWSGGKATPAAAGGAPLSSPQPSAGED